MNDEQAKRYINRHALIEHCDGRSWATADCTTDGWAALRDQLQADDNEIAALRRLVDVWQRVKEMRLLLWEKDNRGLVSDPRVLDAIKEIQEATDALTAIDKVAVRAGD